VDVGDPLDGQDGDDHTGDEVRSEESHLREAVHDEGGGDAAGRLPRVHIGDPVHEIIDLAREENATLIAIGTVGKNRLREVMVGSTTLGVVRNGKSGTAPGQCSCCAVEPVPCRLFQRIKERGETGGDRSGKPISMGVLP
jgi:hypothetical protein